MENISLVSIAGFAAMLAGRTLVRLLTLLRGRTSSCNTTAVSTGAELGPIPVLPVAACLCPNTRSQRSGSDVNRKHRSCTSYPTLPTPTTRSTTQATSLPSRPRSTARPSATSPNRTVRWSSQHLTVRPTTATALRPAQPLALSLNGLPTFRGPLSSGTPTTGRAVSSVAVLTGSSFRVGGSR